MRAVTNYLGFDFEIWHVRQSWFWQALNPCHTGGVIGAAATERVAIREARLAIEEAAAHVSRASATALIARCGRAENPLAMARTKQDWEDVLTSLQGYLSRAGVAPDYALH